MLAHLTPDLAGKRDMALLLVGYAGAFRRSELAGFSVEDLAWVEEGAVLTLGRSKTDQEGQWRKVAIPRGAYAATCPVGALRHWIEAAQITEGPLFRPVDRHGTLRKGRLYPDAVGAIVGRALGRAGFEVEIWGSLAPRRLRHASRQKRSLRLDIMRQTGHRSVQTVSRYVREAQIFRDAPASKLEL